MKITDIYENYRIMPNLQEHQLRVAGVAKMICDNFTQDLDTNSIITACLLHDMGNIVKFKFELYPENVEPEGLEYWQNVQKEFIEKYGPEDHEATHKILEELNVSKNTIELVDAIGFTQAQENAEQSVFEKKVCSYSDMRVAPTGITSMTQRLEDAKNRYARGDNPRFTEEKFDIHVGWWSTVEQQIFEKCSTKPEDINDETVKPFIEKLREFEI